MWDFCYTLYNETSANFGNDRDISMLFGTEITNTALNLNSKNVVRHT